MIETVVFDAYGTFGTESMLQAVVHPDYIVHDLLELSNLIKK